MILMISHEKFFPHYIFFYKVHWMFHTNILMERISDFYMVTTHFLDGSL